MSATRVSRTLALIALLTAGACSSASAEVVSGTPDESIQQAYGPIQSNLSYSGAFDDTSYNDVDYLAFSVPRAGQSFEFTITNTTQGCNDPNGLGCPVYGTLMDATDQQVGGSTSSAGTLAIAGDTETIQWTFAQPGTYYLLMESNGDLPPGNPAYTVRFASAAAGPGATGGPALTSLKVAPRQRGKVVRASLVLGQPAARVTATLVVLQPHGHRQPVAVVIKSNLSAGPHALAVSLPSAWRAALRRQGHLSLLLKLAVATTSGQQASYTRQVKLLR